MDVSVYVTVLQQARSDVTTVRRPAEQQLEKLADSNAPLFFAAMATVLSKSEVQADIRQLAGLLMKSSLDAHNDVLREARATRWLNIDPRTRGTIKTLVTTTMSSTDPVAAHTAAQVVAAIGSIELRADQWKELLPGLLSTVNKTHLECLGYLCEELPPEFVDQSQINQILFRIMTGMRKDQSDDLRKTACSALYNTLDFASSNMKVPEQCKVIMEAIFDATECTNKDVRLVAYQCLVRVAELYYSALGPFIPRAYERTVLGMTTMEEDVARQALEFWSTLADEELNLKDMEEDAAAAGRAPDARSQGYCLTAVPNFVPILLKQMCKQSEFVDSGSWDLAMASGTCLGALAAACGDPVFHLVFPWVKANIASDDWHHREAATLAFGSCMSGPSRGLLMPKILQVLPFFLGKLVGPKADAQVAVRDTTAWTLGRILAFHFAFLKPMNDILPALLQALKQAVLNDEPRVATNCCYALHSMAEAMEHYGDRSQNLLSPHFQDLVTTLIKCASRDDSMENNLRESAYEAVIVLVQHSADDVVPLILRLTTAVLDFLRKSVNTPINTADDKEEQYGLQCLLCALLQVIILRVGSKIVPVADTVFQLLMRVFETKHATAAAEAYMAMGALVSAMEGAFERHMGAFFPRLCAGLAAARETGVCIAAVGVVSDLCRVLEAKMLPSVGILVPALLKNLEDKMLHRSVKPGMLAAFGDIVLAVGSAFPENLIEPVMNMLAEAATMTAPDDDVDLLEFIQTLRSHVLEGFTGMVQGLNSEPRMAPKLQKLNRYVPTMVNFLQRIANDQDTAEDLVMPSVALMGDLCHVLPAPTSAVLSSRLEWVQQLLRDCLGSDDTDAVEMAKWTSSLLPDTPVQQLTG